MWLICYSPCPASALYYTAMPSPRLSHPLDSQLYGHQHCSCCYRSGLQPRWRLVAGREWSPGASADILSQFYTCTTTCRSGARPTVLRYAVYPPTRPKRGGTRSPAAMIPYHLLYRYTPSGLRPVVVFRREAVTVQTISGIGSESWVCFAEREVAITAPEGIRGKFTRPSLAACAFFERGRLYQRRADTIARCLAHCFPPLYCSPYRASCPSTLDQNVPQDGQVLRLGVFTHKQSDRNVYLEARVVAAAIRVARDERLPVLPIRPAFHEAECLDIAALPPEGHHPAGRRFQGFGAAACRTASLRVSATAGTTAAIAAGVGHVARAVGRLRGRASQRRRQ